MYDKEKDIIAALETGHKQHQIFDHIVEDELNVIFKRRQEKARDMRAWFSWGIISVLLIFGFVGGLFAFIPQLSTQDTSADTVIAGTIVSRDSNSKIFEQTSILDSATNTTYVTSYNLTDGGQVLLGFVLASLSFGAVLASTFALVDKLEEDKEEEEIAEVIMNADIRMAKLAHAGDKKLAHEVAKLHDELAALKASKPRSM